MTVEPASETGRILVEIARASLREAFGGSPAPRSDDDWLRAPGASFVTLTMESVLRGCVGTVRAYRSLYEDVWQNSRAAAFRDDRFPPLTEQELPRILIEVSVLSPMEACGSEAELLAILQPGVHGVLLECGAFRATFLPQVWAQLPVASDFLAHLKRKAGLEPTSSSEELTFWRYTVDKWREEDV
jgi:AmmeMemoRadiSam system protein A